MALIFHARANDYLAEIADALFADAFGNLEDNAALSDIANITMGQSPAGTSYNEEGVGTVFYQGRGEFGWRYPTRRLFTTEPKRMAKSGDVLMSVRAPVGDLNLAYEDCCIGRGLVAISCDYPSYCLYLMRSLGKKLDAYNGEGTVFGSISGKALKGIGIGLPGNDDIAAFEAMVAPIDAQIRCNETESRILSQLRDALLPKLMSGEIDVSKVDLTRLNNHFFKKEHGALCGVRQSACFVCILLCHLILRSGVDFFGYYDIREEQPCHARCLFVPLPVETFFPLAFNATVLHCADPQHWTGAFV